MLSSSFSTKTHLIVILDTPDYYEPPFFEACKSNADCLRAKSCSVRLGSVSSGFHKMTCRADRKMWSTCLSGTPKVPSEIVEEEDECEPVANCSQATEIIERESSNDVQGVIEIDNDEEDKMDMNKGKKVQKKKKKRLNYSGISFSVDETDWNMSRSDLSDDSDTGGSADNCDCICQLNGLRSVKVLICTSCGKRVHPACNIHLDGDDVDGAKPRKIKCVFCTGNIDKDSPNIRHFARLRLILASARKDGNFPTEILNLLPLEDRPRITSDLEAFGIYSPGSSRLNKWNLDKAVNMLFELPSSQFFY